MKNIKYIVLAAAMVFATACEQELIETVPADPDMTNLTPDPCTGSAGSANFTKFIAIGNSLVAGVQGGALFDEGQANSLALILNTQFACVSGGSTFVQPTINTPLGFNLFISPNPTAGGTVLGRMLLQGTPPRPTPQVSNTGAIPNPAVNPGFIYTGAKSALNNFSFPAIVLGQSLIPQTGNWAGAGVDPRFNPFYGRLAYPGTGTSTIIGDAAAAGGTFFLFWLGLDDFFLHAAYGGDPTKAPLTPTGPLPTGFDGQYAAAVGSLLASNPELKGVVGNFPNIFAMPHFRSVVWNPIPLDAATAAAVTASLANNYNGFLTAMVGAGIITEQEKTARILTYFETNPTGPNNSILISDETLTDLSPYMAGPAAALLPYARARQTKSTDIIPLSTGTILGTTVGGDPTKVNGVTVPLGDQYALIPSEIVAIETARTSFNATVKGMADANPTRLAFADVNKAYSDFVAAQALVMNNITITPLINPPTGIFSEDGIHPNSRGYAYLSNIFIEAINTKFGASVPLTNISKYKATGLPIP
ncbi:MAG TPA: hypothetical protein VE467_10005 [Chryseolinea sp.]|jgi:hypothetical protein|nr:hypothetical protein [Chryseolinea sp.]